MTELKFPNWIEKLFLNCEQVFPGKETFVDEFLGPTYSDGTTGPTSLRQALTALQEQAKVCMQDGERTHEIFIYVSGERFSWTLELCYEPPVTLSFYTECWQDTVTVCQRLNIDPMNAWAGNGTMGPY